MSEGMARLNQQVVGTDYWDRSDRLSPLEGGLPLGASDPAQGNRAVRTNDIRDVVEADVIPRLMPGRNDKAPGAPADRVLQDADVRHFSTLLLGGGTEHAIEDYVEAVRARGLSVDHVYLDLFQPAARHVGDLWAADLCTFVDVTLAIGTMQRLMRALGSEFHRNGRSASGSRLALLAPLPGDQPTFGLPMVAEFFRRSGWTVWTTPFGSTDDMIATVRSTWFAVVGFSVSRDDRVDEVSSTIERIRRESVNAEVGIMVGGPAFVTFPELATRIGADAVSCNAMEALAQAEAFAAR